MAFGEDGGTVPADRSGEEVLAGIRVVHTGHVGLHLLLGESGAETVERTDASHVVPEGAVERKVLGLHRHDTVVIAVGGVEERQTDGVLAELAVVGEDLVESPG